MNRVLYVVHGRPAGACLLRSGKYAVRKGSIGETRLPCLALSLSKGA